MSENLELVRSIYADWERGDFSRADWADPDIEFVRDVELEPEHATGVAGMARVWRRWLAQWADFHTAEVDSYRELDDGRVLVTGRMSGRGKASGADVHREFVNLFQLRDGLITKLTLYNDRDRAFSDLGLEE